MQLPLLPAPFMRVLAIGDVHGCATALHTLVAGLELRADDVLVMLGDYIDRGPDSKGVIESLLDLEKKVRLVCLRGNHEVMLLHAREHRETALFWLGCGGDATMESYSAETFEDIPGAHWDFLLSTVRWFETETHFFVHANAEPKLPLAEQPDEVIFWKHLVRPWFGRFPRHCSGKTMVCGHTSQPSGEILDLGSVICIDTFAHGGQWLTCLEPASRRCWQANEKGDFRRSRLPIGPQGKS